MKRIQWFTLLFMMGIAMLGRAQEDTIKVGLITSMSGPFANNGKQMENGIKTFMKQHGDKVAGKKIELLIRDSTGAAPEIAKRLAQELVSRDKVDFLVGFEFTPNALAAAPVALARAAFEEVIRYASPVQTFFRTTTKDVEVAGVKIGEGQKVLLFLAAANRDPRKWEEPDRFSIRRRATGHVGFGSGIHMCVGQMVARLEAEVVLTALARKVESIELTGDPKWRLNNTLRGLDTLPIAIRPTAS